MSIDRIFLALSPLQPIDKNPRMLCRDAIYFILLHLAAAATAVSLALNAE